MISRAATTASASSSAQRRSLEQISFHRCPAAQGDVIVSGDYAFVSIDSPCSNSRESKTCNNTPTDVSDSSLREGGPADRRHLEPATSRHRRASSRPSAARTRRPSFRARKRSYIYVQSYPLTDVDICTKADPSRGRDLGRLVPDRRPVQGPERGRRRHHPRPRRDARHGRLPRRRRPAGEGPRRVRVPRRLRDRRHLRSGGAGVPLCRPEPADRARPLRSAHLGRQDGSHRRRARWALQAAAAARPTRRARSARCGSTTSPIPRAPRSRAATRCRAYRRSTRPRRPSASAARPTTTRSCR